MSAIAWRTFDADKPDPEMNGEIKRIVDCVLTADSVDEQDRDAVRSYAMKKIKEYEAGGDAGKANKTLGINIFRPHEFDDISSDDDKSLTTLAHWIRQQRLDWRQGSRTLQTALDAGFPSGGLKVVAGGRERVFLDNLVVIERRRAAVEIETSKNIDNGFWTLRQALRNDMADYGVMIVPWTPERSGQADEGKATGRLDREFDSTTPSHGAIYRIAIIRLLDIYRWMLRS